MLTAQRWAEGQEGLLCQFLGNKDLFLHVAVGLSSIEQPPKMASSKGRSQNSLFLPNTRGNRAKKWGTPIRTILADPR